MRGTRRLLIDEESCLLPTLPGHKRLKCLLSHLLTDRTASRHQNLIVLTRPSVALSLSLSLSLSQARLIGLSFCDPGERNQAS
jgi:hypothetical protein